jgi:hormone-sensitive lipase
LVERYFHRLHVNYRVLFTQLRVKAHLKATSPSKNLIFHVHGGGFAAQTSKSHETYLKEWATKLDCPILSIDYSLALQAPFPRALEEVFYAYCWALKNIELLGSSGENIVLVGDSAGGNLITACTIKCIEMGIRKPKGLLPIYAVFKDCFAVTPARFMTLIDPFLPYLFAFRLFKSYAGLTEDSDENDNKIEETDIMERKKMKKGKPKNRHDSFEDEFSFTAHKSYFISVHDAPDEVLAQFPLTKVLTSNFDPFLDDSVEFAKKLKNLGTKVSLDIVKGLPHGFLYFSHVS